MKSVTPSKCLCDFCDRDASSRGYCQAHYKHLLKNIAPYPIKERRPRVSNTGKCTVDRSVKKQAAIAPCIMSNFALEKFSTRGDTAQYMRTTKRFALLRVAKVVDPPALGVLNTVQPLKNMA